MWCSPLPLRLVASHQDALELPAGATVLPLGHHPGAFGYVRKHHVHEGVDLYAPEGTSVFAVESGRVVAVRPFTGPAAGLPWWEDTEVVLVEGATGVVAYGEIAPCVRVGQDVAAGARVGAIKRVLRKDKGRPMSMLHLELHIRGTRVTPEWRVGCARPASLRDPTSCLRPLALTPELDLCA